MGTSKVNKDGKLERYHDFGVFTGRGRPLCRIGKEACKHIAVLVTAILGDDRSIEFLRRSEELHPQYENSSGCRVHRRIGA